MSIKHFKFKEKISIFPWFWVSAQIETDKLASGEARSWVTSNFFLKMENILLFAHFYGTSMSVTFLERILEQKENEGFSALFRAPFTGRTQKFLKWTNKRKIDLTYIKETKNKSKYCLL